MTVGKMFEVRFVEYWNLWQAPAQRVDFTCAGYERKSSEAWRCQIILWLGHHLLHKLRPSSTSCSAANSSSPLRQRQALEDGHGLCLTELVETLLTLDP